MSNRGERGCRQVWRLFSSAWIAPICPASVTKVDTSIGIQKTLPDVLSTFQSLVRTELIAWSGEMRRIRGNGGRTVKEQKLSGKNCQIIIVTFSSGINAGALLLLRRPLIEGGRRGGGGGKPFFLAGRVMCVRAAEGQTDRLQRMRDVQL